MIELSLLILKLCGAFVLLGIAAVVGWYLLQGLGLMVVVPIYGAWKLVSLPIHGAWKRIPEQYKVTPWQLGLLGFVFLTGVLAILP